MESTTGYSILAHPESAGNPVWRTVRHRLQRLALAWEGPISSGLLAFAIFAGLSLMIYRDIWYVTPYAYYNQLADALLHGQLHLRATPELTLDLSLYEGRYYLYWGPLPAVLLIPFIALFGLGFSDAIFTCGLAALNVALVAFLVRQVSKHRIITLSPVQRGLMVLFFALGTVHITIAPFGLVWHTAQLVGVCAVAMAYIAALSLRGYWAFALTGVALAAATLTRNHLILTGLFPAIYLVSQHRSLPSRRQLRYVTAGLVPIILGIGLIALYNWARFDSPVENGLAYHQMNPVFQSDYQQYGVFDLHYLPANLYYQYLYYPYPVRSSTLYGGSLFLLSPVFFAAIWAFRSGRSRWHTWSLLVTIVVVAIPILLLMGTGWTQFGPRYTLDFTIPLLLLTAMGVKRWPTWLLAILTMISIAHYLPGAVIRGILELHAVSI